MDGIFQESQKPESPGKTQHESPREFNGHIKAFYSATIQEPVSGLRDPISLTLRTLLVLAVSAFLLPLRAAQGNGKSPERGGAQSVGSGGCGSQRPLLPPHAHTCCVPRGRVAQ